MLPMKRRSSRVLETVAARMPDMISRRSVICGLGVTGVGVLPPDAAYAAAAVTTGAAALAIDAFARLRGKRVGLITNQTGRVGGHHLADLLSRRSDLRLTAILAPEHGFRGVVEAGATVRDGRDPKTGVAVYSLYGATRKPTSTMLRDVDCLVFDVQDVGVRFYTYISTMGLAMQAAAAQRIPFIVLDRPNPIGGEDVSGFVLEPAFKSFVGQYPIPIVHGLTVGELARMIKDERWLSGLASLEIVVVPLQDWRRAMRWPDARLPWLPTSPNVPTFDAALVYPGIGIVGETLVNEGRGTPTPFSQFGAPWLDAEAAVSYLNARQLPGVRFEAVTYTPQSIPNVAAHPRFEGQRINAVRLSVTNIATYRPLEVGIHALAYLRQASRAKGLPLLETFDMFRKIAGTARLDTSLDRGASGTDIIAGWQAEVQQFKDRRGQYLMY